MNRSIKKLIEIEYLTLSIAFDLIFLIKGVPDNDIDRRCLANLTMMELFKYGKEKTLIKYLGER